LAREFINRIQNLRKYKGFKVTDKINILVEKNEALSSAIQNNFIYICDETLAEQLKFIDKLNNEEDKIELIDNISAKVSIKKQ
jgi:isoleucyl-tRNA synthetase